MTNPSLSVHVPLAEDPQAAAGLHDEALLPPFLVADEQSFDPRQLPPGMAFEPVKDVDLGTVTRLYPPEVSGLYSLRKDVQERLEQLSGASGNCTRCAGTGVNRWRQRGHIASVCKCVQHGAIAEIAAEALEDLEA